MIWVFVVVVLIVGLIAALVTQAAQGRSIDRRLRATAESVGGWPIAYLRADADAHIVLMHSAQADGEPKLLLIQDGQRSALTSEELITLWHKRRVQWYCGWRTPEKNLGMRQFVWLISSDDAACALWNKPQEQFLRWWAIIGLSVMIPFILFAVGTMVVELLFTH